MSRLALVTATILPLVLGGSMASARAYALDACAPGTDVCRVAIDIPMPDLVNPARDVLAGDGPVARQTSPEAPVTSIRPRPRPALLTAQNPAS